MEHLIKHNLADPNNSLPQRYVRIFLWILTYRFLNRSRFGQVWIKIRTSLVGRVWATQFQNWTKSGRYGKFLVTFVRSDDGFNLIWQVFGHFCPVTETLKRFLFLLLILYKNDSEKNFLDKWYIFLDWGQKIEIDQNWESSIENKASWTLLITWEILSANQRRAFHYSPTHTMRKKLKMENSKILSEKIISMKKRETVKIFSANYYGLLNRSYASCSPLV